MTEIETADVDTQTPPDVSGDIVTVEENGETLLHDMAQEAGVTGKDKVIIQQVNDESQAILLLPDNDSIVSSEAFKQSVLSLATSNNIVDDGSLSMMGGDGMSNTVVVTTLEEDVSSMEERMNGVHGELKGDEQIQVTETEMNQVLVDGTDALASTINSATCANLNGHQVIILSADGTVTCKSHTDNGNLSHTDDDVFCHTNTNESNLSHTHTDDSILSHTPMIVICHARTLARLLAHTNTDDSYLFNKCVLKTYCCIG